jgi:tetratricopeptide (TPR) repeat protein
VTPAASSAARRILREDYLGASTFVEKGWNFIAIGNFYGAEGILLRALELAPSDVRGKSLLGWALMRQGKLLEAEQVLVGLLSENTLNSMARVNLGYVYMKKGDVARASELLVSSSRQNRDPKAALYAVFYRGLLLASEENFTEAELCFRKSIQLAPNFVEGYYELGRAQLGEVLENEARATWKTGHSINRINIWGKRCLDAIRLIDHGYCPPSFS